MAMRLLAVLSMAIVVACGGGKTLTASHTPTPTVSSARTTASASPPPSGSPAATPAPGPLSASAGLLIAGGFLQMVSPDAKVVASVPIANPSAHSCPGGGTAFEAPPVSASADHVYFRDGNTKIKMVVPPAASIDVTSVPGSATVVSSFSVSPDDQRIAVLVEDLSGAASIGLRLYVEDLHGGTNHVEIYRTTTGQSGGILWPAGWHQGALVLALVTPCFFEPAAVRVAEWHMSNAATAQRITTIKANNCELSFFPSAAGVGCVQFASGATAFYEWSGRVSANAGPPSWGVGLDVTGLSPAGQSAFFAPALAEGPGLPPQTQIRRVGAGSYATLAGHSACLWIDEDHLLAPDGVIQFPAETPGNLRVQATFTALPAAGYCVGRFPGTL